MKLVNGQYPLLRGGGMWPSQTQNLLSTFVPGNFMNELYRSKLAGDFVLKVYHWSRDMYYTVNMNCNEGSNVALGD